MGSKTEIQFEKRSIFREIRRFDRQRISDPSKHKRAGIPLHAFNPASISKVDMRWQNHRRNFAQ